MHTHTQFYIIWKIWEVKSYIHSSNSVSPFTAKTTSSSFMPRPFRPTCFPEVLFAESGREAGVELKMEPPRTEEWAA